MNASLKIGHIWGIPVQLHWSLLLVFGLLAWSLAVGYFPAEYPTLSLPTYWLRAVMTSVLFFGSVLLIVGILSREQVFGYLRLRFEFGLNGNAKVKIGQEAEAA